MELGLALTLCGLGTAFLIPAIMISAVSANKKRTCAERASAIVTDIKARYSSDRGPTFHPVYEYTVDGVEYTAVGSALSGKTPAVNSSITIMYDPCKPKKSYIPGYDSKVYKILSAVFAIIGLIPIVVCVIISLTL